MKIALTIIGALLILAGVVWFFQGIGILAGSMMSGQSQWGYIGVITAVVGIVLVALAFWRRGSPSK
ncbi:MAG: hypothetical protein ABSB41_07605 [Anaerolineales bacterium]|jgi:uncharacterized membrane protein HdeD (DUF308 family)